MDTTLVTVIVIVIFICCFMLNLYIFTGSCYQSGSHSCGAGEDSICSSGLSGTVPLAQREFTPLFSGTKMAPEWMATDYVHTPEGPLFVLLAANRCGVAVVCNRDEAADN